MTPVPDSVITIWASAWCLPTLRKLGVDGIDLMLIHAHADHAGGARAVAGATGEARDRRRTRGLPNEWQAAGCESGRQWPGTA
jgi:competence protein ComEC